MSTPAPSYNISGSIKAINPKADHDFEGRNFNVVTTTDVTMDSKLVAIGSSSTTDVKIGEDTTNVLIDSNTSTSVRSQALLEVGVHTDASFTSLDDCNSNSNTYLLTKQGTYAMANTQSLYYADPSGKLQMLDAPDSTDQVRQILGYSGGNLEWKDAEAAALLCLGACSTYDTSTTNEFEVTRGQGNYPGTGLVMHAYTGTTGTSSQTESFEPHQTGDYQVTALMTFNNIGSTGEADVSGHRTLSFGQLNVADISANTVMQNKLMSVTEQPNPDSDIDTPLMITGVFKLTEGNKYGLCAESSHDSNSGTISAHLRKFDIHYVCDSASINHTSG